MSKLITAVLIDTSAYYNRQFDFSGINSAMIPTFLRLLESNHISILRHPILDDEIRKNIQDSHFVTNAQKLCRCARKSKALLASKGIMCEDILAAVDPSSVVNSLLDAYAEVNRNAIMLSYGDAEKVFYDYFHARPPFSLTGNKKAEFPDAFVIKGLLKYCENHTEAQILVVSSDPDWKNALEDCAQVYIVQTLKDAMAFLWQQFGDKTEFVTHIWSPMIPQIMSEIASAAECEAFVVEDIYDFENIDITEIRATSMIGDMTPLEVTDNSVLVHASASLSLNGTIDFLDEDRSQWDSEDQSYYFTAYTRMGFEDASAEIECEVRLSFPADGSMKNINVDDVKIVSRGDIRIDVSEAETTEEDITDYGDDEWLD